MANDGHASSHEGWLEASGLLHLFRILGLSVQPAKLGIALGAIILTFVLGTMLDWFWTANGGIGEDAVARFIIARGTDTPYTDPEGELGVFHVWREHERGCVLGLMGSSIPGASVAAGTPVGIYVQSHSAAQPLSNLVDAGYGFWWLFRMHPFYFVLFGAGCLVIWSCAGGAICRLSALQFARDEKLTMRQGLTYARQHLFDGFVLAPCIPLGFIVVLMLALALFGVLLRVWFLGDLLGGVLFVLPIFGGVLMALLLIGTLVGGHLFWPAVATEGQDAYDAFSRGLSYAFTKPWKTMLYAVIATVYASICWLFVNLFTFLALTLTRGIVSWGTSPFGLWRREIGDTSIAKLELLWPLGGANALYRWPDTTNLAWHEYISVFFIAIYVLLVIALMWSFLASFYFSSCTVVYFLLRRDVDKTDLDDLYIDDEDLATSSIAPNTAEASAADPGVSLPIIDSPFPTAGPAAGASADTDSEPPYADQSEPDSTETESSEPESSDTESSEPESGDTESSEPESNDTGSSEPESSDTGSS